MISYGFIGFGKMAEALCKGILDESLASKDAIYFTEKESGRVRDIESKYEITSCSLESLVETCEVILCCIKPQGIHDLLNQFPTKRQNQQVIVSILAGVPVATFQKSLGETSRIVRVMPNTPSLLGYGMSGLYFNGYVMESEKKMIRALFNGVGQSIIVEDESLLDVVTGVSGSGPAFVYRFAQEIAKEGVSQGLSKKDSIKLIAQTLIGAGHMLLKSGFSSEELIQQVSSPGGTTVAGLEQCDQVDFDDHIKSIVRASILRSRELGKESS